MSAVLYFAYGSNLDERQMARRCPGAIPVAPARVDGFRLAFRGYSVTRRGAVATILPARRASVPGLLYVIGQQHLERLDRFEGHPGFYQRVEVGVRLDAPAIEAREHAAVTYMLRSALALFRPSAEYAAIIERAYRRHGLPYAALRRARRERLLLAEAG